MHISEDFQSRANKAICEVCGCPTEAITVIIQDVPKTKWGRVGKSYG